MTDKYDQFKHGDQNLVRVVDKSKIDYDGYIIKVGQENCKCSAYDIYIRNAFTCDKCHHLHAHECSKQDPIDIIINDHSNIGENRCIPCTDNN